MAHITQTKWPLAIGHLKFRISLKYRIANVEKKKRKKKKKKKKKKERPFTITGA